MSTPTDLIRDTESLASETTLASFAESRLLSAREGLISGIRGMSTLHLVDACWYRIAFALA
jgi:hypothetical protein